MESKREELGNTAQCKSASVRCARNSTLARNETGRDGEAARQRGGAEPFAIQIRVSGRFAGRLLPRVSLKNFSSDEQCLSILHSAKPAEFGALVVRKVCSRRFRVLERLTTVVKRTTESVNKLVPGQVEDTVFEGQLQPK